VQARKHTTSLCVCRVLRARSVNLICKLLAEYMFSAVSFCTCMHKHIHNRAVCECVSVYWLNRGILSVSQDNAGSDSKPLLETFCLASSLAS